MDSITEYIAAILGGFVVIVGFAYGIYDTYFRKTNCKDSDTSKKDK